MKVRAKIKKNMTVSGEHDSDPFNFTEVARKSVRGGALTNIGCYYFFIRCNEYPEVDVCFNLQLDDKVAGNTDDKNVLNVPTPGSSGKKLAMKTMVDISNFSQEIAAEMKETNRLALEANKVAKSNQLIQLAQLLGKTDALEHMFANFAAASGVDLP